MQSARKGERQGWLFGWLGGFLWVAILAFWRLAQGDIPNALMGSALIAAAVTAVLVLAPWRHPTRPYWVLMTPIYLLFFLSVAWLVRISGGLAALGLSVWSLFLLLPLLLPFYLAGKRRWMDGEPKGL
jgi:hypothetical protein